MPAAEPRKPRRTANACIPCRQSKIKCSGNEPCANCQRRIIRCRFADEGQKVTVSERYLQELQRQAQEQQANSNNHTSPGLLSPVSQRHSIRVATPVEPFTPPQPLENELSIYTSPFTTTSATIRNRNQDRRGWIWLAPSSTWSFTVRLALLLADKLHMQGPHNLLGFMSQWGDTYSLKWHPFPDHLPPDMTSGLPTLDHAIYLFNTVKFHLGQHYRFFDDEVFLANIHEFYAAPPADRPTTTSRLWFAQFLLVLAFGNAFLSRSRKPQEPPGAKYFLRAMSLMPDLSAMWRDSLLAIEAMAMAGLYLYCVDCRESAGVYVGQAIRFAQMEGLHTRLPDEELGPRAVARCRDLWWTLYIMDRNFSSSLGIPTGISDSDVTTLWYAPYSDSPTDETLFHLQAKLWHQLSVILDTIYKTQKFELGEFLGTTRSILHTMAGLAQEIENIINYKFQNSVDTMSKGTRHITLLYHQCVIVATRPLLLSVLHERLDRINRGDGGDENWNGFFALTTTLISAGIKSAMKTLEILSREESLLEAFLPFDLEFLYGAALHMLMASTLFPDDAHQNMSHGLACSQMTHASLDEMISKGNRVAEVRKDAITRLEALFHELTLQSERQGLQTLSLAGGGSVGGSGSSTVGVPSSAAATAPPTMAMASTATGGHEKQQAEVSHGGVGMEERDDYNNGNDGRNSFDPSSVVMDSENDDGTAAVDQLNADFAAASEAAAATAASGSTNFDFDPHLPPSSSLTFLDDIGISSGEFFSIVDQMGNEDMFLK